MPFQEIVVLRHTQSTTRSLSKDLDPMNVRKHRREGRKLKLTGENKEHCILRIQGRIQRSMAELLYNWDVREVDRLSADLVDIVLSFTSESSISDSH